VLEDESSRTEIALSNVEVNPQIDPKVFSTEFPPDTEIIYRGSSAGVLDASEEGLP
jgi:outer membrane lipoprotein-sorting protein